MPRPALGDLIKSFNSDATLDGRTLALAVASGEHRTERKWSEHVYAAEENAERERIQQRVWRIGRGETSSADHEADLRSEHWAEVEERVARRIEEVDS